MCIFQICGLIRNNNDEILNMPIGVNYKDGNTKDAKLWEPKSKICDDLFP